MKLVVNCPVCLLENKIPSYDFKLFHVREDGLYKSTCTQGHEFLTNAQLLKYEVMIDCAFLALRDGYIREATANLAAALERFYEFYIRLVCMKYKIEDNVFNKSWSQMSSSSERQHGAFIAMHMINGSNFAMSAIENSKPEIHNTSANNTKNWKEFRNSVIHKGYIPTYNEAYSYAELVFIYLKRFHVFLKEYQLDDFNNARTYYLSKEINNVDNLPVSNLGIASILLMSDDYEFTLENVLIKFYEYHDYIQNLPNLK